MKRKILHITTSVMALMLAFVIGVSASDSIREVTAYINYAMTMKVDNTEWNPTEDDGSAIRPIIYNNRTYLPLRTLCDKLGVAVDYDGNTQTVYVGEKEWTPIKADMVKKPIVFDYNFTTDSDKLFHGNGVYTSGIMFSKIQRSKNIAEIFTEGRYNSMKFSVYASGKKAVLKVIDAETGAMYKEAAVNDGESYDFEADIHGAKKLSIEVTAPESPISGFAVMGDIMFK